MPPTTEGASGLPSPADRERILQCLTELVQAFAAHPKMQPPYPNRTLFHMWDFTQRTRYIVSELDTIVAGQPLKHPEQIPEYRNGARPGIETARKCMSDVYTRSSTMDMMITNPTMLPIMGLETVDVGDEVKQKAKAFMDCLKSVRGS